MPSRNVLIAIPVGGIVAALVAGVLLWPVESRVPVPAPPAAANSVLLGASPPLAIESCAECHAEVCESFAAAPHFRTLHRASEPGIRERFAGRSVELGGVEFRYDLRDGLLQLKAGSARFWLPVDWIFGSGQHGLTPVSLPPASYPRSGMLEHHVSWYPDGLHWTVGHRAVVGEGLDSLGNWLPDETVQQCFGCHSTWTPPKPDGRIDLDRIVTGVRCQRCHEQADEHARAMRGGGDPVPIERWSDLTPAESVARCSECHRAETDFTADELRPDNTALLRFAPVGLSQSPCFQQQHLIRTADGGPARMDCTTCHDPHGPARTDPAWYLKTCLECHGELPHQAAICSAQPMTSQCLECHMPRRPFEKYVGFTDHWIRIPED